VFPRLSRPLLTFGLALASLAVAPGVVVAKPFPPPTFLDTATASGDNLVLDDFSAFDIHVDAFSGPSGQDPGGHVSFGFNPLFGVGPVTGPVTCLEVTGNTAVMTVAGPFASFPNFPAFTVKVVDNGGSGLDRFQYFPIPPENSQYLDCRANPIPTDFGGPLIGRAEVFDSPPPPAAKSDCRHGGWAQFGFRNRRQCIRYVKRTQAPARRDGI
jgi:hypothetical protein